MTVLKGSLSSRRSPEGSAKLTARREALPEGMTDVPGRSRRALADGNPGREPDRADQEIDLFIGRRHEERARAEEELRKEAEKQGNETLTDCVRVSKRGPGPPRQGGGQLWPDTIGQATKSAAEAERLQETSYVRQRGVGYLEAWCDYYLDLAEGLETLADANREKAARLMASGR
jgi:hypothetical protein